MWTVTGSDIRIRSSIPSSSSLPLPRAFFFLVVVDRPLLSESPRLSESTLTDRMQKDRRNCSSELSPLPHFFCPLQVRPPTLFPSPISPSTPLPSRIEVATTGWVAIGFNPDDYAMTNADIVAAYGSTSIAVKDMFSRSLSSPSDDAIQNIQNPISAPPSETCAASFLQSLFSMLFSWTLWVNSIPGVHASARRCGRTRQDDRLGPSESHLGLRSDLPFTSNWGILTSVTGPRTGMTKHDQASRGCTSVTFIPISMSRSSTDLFPSHLSRQLRWRLRCLPRSG